VSIVDVSPIGLGFESSVPYDPEARVAVLASIPDARGDVHDVTLPLEVRSCVESQETYGYRIGCRVLSADLEVHDRLVEFCDVVVPLERLGRRPAPVVALRDETRATA
jgi:hypothetical protein